MATLWRMTAPDGRWALQVHVYREAAQAAGSRDLACPPHLLSIRRAAQADIDRAKAEGVAVPDGGWGRLGPLQVPGIDIRLGSQAKALLSSDLVSGNRVLLDAKWKRKTANHLALSGIVLVDEERGELILTDPALVIRERVIEEKSRC